MAGGDGTLRGYAEAAAAEQNRSTATQAADWRALYTQFLAEHALGTIPYRWERGHDEAILVQATIPQPLDVVVVGGAQFHQGNIGGTEKASIIKKQLGIPLDEP